jgi:uncharacterized protein
MRPVLGRIKQLIYGVFGNHDTIRMVPDLEAMRICMLLNECEPIMHGGATIYLAGIDNAHYFRVENIRNLSTGSPCRFRFVAEWPYPGGRICLPGSVPLTLDSVLPRRFGAGAWQYHNMAGYTSTGVGSSIVAVRINCLPEIPLHRVWRPEEEARINKGGRAIAARKETRAVFRPQKSIVL